MPAKKHKANVEKIEPGMVVEAAEGDLGETDVSKPKVEDVVEDHNGNVEKVVVTKGIAFKKKIEIPAGRIQSVDSPSQEDTAQGKVIIDTNQREIASLTSAGEESLTPEKQDSLLDTLEQEIPTAEGMRELEYSSQVAYAQKSQNPEVKKREAAEVATRGEGEKPDASKETRSLLQVLGPGFLSGMAGNDSSAVTAYAVDGATTGYGHLWLMLLSTPLYQAIQYACAKIGRVSQKGLSELLREHYSPWVAFPASLILIIANVALIAADLVAISSGLELITGLRWYWFVILIAAILWYLTVYRSFETIKKFFIVMSLAFVTYIITAIFSRADWQAVLVHTFVPQIDFDFASISSAVALLGATFSPYSMFWQVQGEKEESRAGSQKQQLRGAALDVALGVVAGNLVSYFIIVCTAATLFAHHQNINTAADAASALEPLLGPFAKYLFAIGLIGAGLIAIPVLLASTSYAVTGTVGWPAGLSKKPWQNEGFYLILTAALAASLVLTLLHFNPIQLIFWANVLSGVLAPILVTYIFVIGNNRRIMRNQPLGLITNIGLVVTVLISVAAAAILFYGLATGQGG
jgi:NRAMP (natural resistance-associated macrophage protein)-like metal ion transporter